LYLISYCNVNRNQQSTDEHKGDSVDEDNQDVVIGDNSNPITVDKELLLQMFRQDPVMSAQHD